jgi:glycosyltransferase involved in cell wall biosynthesis
MLSVLAMLVGRLKGWKTVCWLQDVFPEIALKAGVLNNGKQAFMLMWLAHRSLRTTDRVVVVGRCMEQRLLAVGVSQDRLTVISNWADGEGLQPVAPANNWFRQQHQLDGRIVVMYSGNLGVVHETESLLRIIRGLSVMPEVCVMILGEGSGRISLEETVRREQLGNVRFLGYQRPEDLRFSLSAGDIHLVTLRPEMEGLSVPSKVYGIMAVSRPVVFIGPQGSEVTALIREAGCGEAFAPAEYEKATLAILDLARDTRRREYLGTAGRRYFEDYLDKPLAVQRFHDVLRSTVKAS